MKKFFKQHLLLSLTAASVLASAPITYAQETTPPSTTDNSASNKLEQILAQENPIFENDHVFLPSNITINKTVNLYESSLDIPVNTILTIDKTGKLASHNKLNYQKINVHGTLDNKGTISLDYDGKHKNEDGNYYTEILVGDSENDTPTHFNSMPGSTLTTTNARAVVRIMGREADANLTDTNIENVLFSSMDGATTNIKNTDKSKTLTNASLLRTIANGQINLDNVFLTSPKSEEPTENNGSMDQKGQYTVDYYEYYLDEYSKNILAECLSGNEELLNILEKEIDIPEDIHNKINTTLKEEPNKYRTIYNRLLENKLTDDEYAAMKKLADLMTKREHGQITIKNSDLDTKGFIEASDKGTIIFHSDDNSNKYKVLALNAIQDGQIIIDGGTLEVEKFIGSFNSEESILKDSDKKPGHIILQKGTLKAANLRELFDDKLIKAYLPKIMKKDEDVKETEANIDKRFTDKILVLKNNGVIETISDQIFANKADRTQEKSGELTNNSIDYQGGNIVFNDTEYTNKYLEDLVAEEGKKGAKSTITFGETSKLYKVNEKTAESTDEIKDNEENPESVVTPEVSPTVPEITIKDEVPGDKSEATDTDKNQETEVTPTELETATKDQTVEPSESKDEILNRKIELNNENKNILVGKTVTIGEKGQLLSNNTEDENYINVNVNGTLINNGVIALDYHGKHQYDNGNFYNSLKIINEGKNEAKLISNPGSTIKTSNRAVVRIAGKKASAILTDTNLDNVNFNVADGADLTIKNSKGSEILNDYSIRTIGAATVNIENSKIGKADAKLGANHFGVEEFGAYTQDYYEYHMSGDDYKKLATLLGSSDSSNYEANKELILSVIDNKENNDKYDLLKQFADEKNNSTKANVVIKNSDIITDNVIEAADGGTVTLQSENNDNTYKLAGLNAIQDGKVVIDGGNLEVTKFMGSFNSSASILRQEDINSGKIILQKGTLTAPNLRAITDVNLVQEHLQKIGEQEIAEIPDSYMESKKAAKTDFHKGLNELKESLNHRFTDKVLVLKNEGTIKTISNQIFANKADKTQEKAGELNNNFIDYQGGNIVFNDTEYTNKYLEDLIAEEGKKGAKSTITFSEASKLYKVNEKTAESTDEIKDNEENPESVVTPEVTPTEPETTVKDEVPGDKSETKDTDENQEPVVAPDVTPTEPETTIKDEVPGDKSETTATDENQEPVVTPEVTPTEPETTIKDEVPGDKSETTATDENQEPVVTPDVTPTEPETTIKDEAPGDKSETTNTDENQDPVITPDVTPTEPETTIKDEAPGDKSETTTTDENQEPVVAPEVTPTEPETTVKDVVPGDKSETTTTDENQEPVVAPEVTPTEPETTVKDEVPGDKSETTATDENQEPVVAPEVTPTEPETTVKDEVPGDKSETTATDENQDPVVTPDVTPTEPKTTIKDEVPDNKSETTATDENQDPVVTPDVTPTEPETATKDQTVEPSESKDEILNRKIELNNENKNILVGKTLTIGEKGQLLSNNTEDENYINVNVNGTLINNGVIALDYHGKHQYDNGDFYTSLNIINEGKNEAKLISNPGSTIKTSNRAVVHIAGEKASAILTDTNLDNVKFNVADGADLTIKNSKGNEILNDYSIRTIGAATVNIENSKIGKADAKFGANDFSVEEFGAYTQDYYEHHMSADDYKKLATLLGSSDSSNHEANKELILSVIDNKENNDKYDLLKQFADEKNNSTKANVVIKNSDIITDNVIEAADGGTVTLQSENNDNTYKLAGLNAIQDGKVVIDGGNLEVTKFIGSFNSSASILRQGDINSGKIILQKGTLTAPNLRAITDVNLVQEHLQKIGEQEIAEIPDSYTESKKAAKTDFHKVLNELKGSLDHRFTDKVLVLKDNGVVETISDQIFANKADDKQEKAGELTNNFIDYQGGTIIFNDKAYTDKYLTNAIEEKDKIGAKTKIKFGKQSHLYKIENNKGYELVTEQTLTDAAKYNGEISIPQPVKVENKTTKPITKVVIGNTKGEGIASTEGKNLQASKLILPTTVSDLNVEADKNLRIGGYTDGNLVETVNKKVMATVNGTMTIGEAGLKQKNSIINVNIKGDGNLVVSNAKVAVDKENKVDLSAMKVDIVNNGSLELVGETTILGNQTKINVGDTIDNGILKAANVKLNGATVLLDPVFKDGQKYSEAYIIPKNGELDGKVIVGRNSILVLGSTDTAKTEAFDKFLSASSDKYGAGVYIAAPTKVTGSLKIDKKATDAKNPAADKSVEIANNSLIIIGAEALVEANGEKAALTADKVVLPVKATDTDTKEKSPAKVFAGDYGAQLKIVGTLTDMAKLQDVLAKAKTENKNIVLVEGNTVENNLTKPVEFSDLLDLQVQAQNGKITLSVKNKDGKIFKSTAEAYKTTPVLLANTIDKTIETTLANLKANKPVEETSQGMEFLNLITNSPEDKATKALAFNSMANMSDLAGITKQAYTNLTQFNDAVMNHANNNSNELWAMYTNHNENKIDLELTNTQGNLKAKSNGIILGKNLQQNANNTLGVAVFYNKTNITADNNISNTKNDASGYGLSLYTAKKLTKLNILANVTYAHNSNDIKHINAGFTAKAKANTTNYSLGIQAEQPILAGNNVVTPYVGLRFLHLGGASFNNTLGFKYDIKAQNLLELPLGLRYENNIVKGNKTIKPYAELGYNALLSGKTHKVSVGLNNGVDSFNNTVLGNLWHAKLGVTMEAKNNSFSLSYGHYQGKFNKDNQVMAQAKFNF